MAHGGSVFRETFNFRIGTSPIYQLKNRTRESLDFIQRLKLDTKLEAHSGCVNTICWNETGTHILSGSDDQHLSITDPFSKKISATIHSGHRANIFSARFLPNTQDKRIISCSGDGVIYYTQADREETHGQNAFVCHFGTAYEVQTIPQDPNSFLSCGEDCTVRWFDLRIKTKCGKPDCKEDILINCRRAVTALAVNPISPWQLSVGCSDSSVRVFDRRMLGTRATGNYTGRGLTGMVSRFTTPLLESRSHRITSLAYSPCGEDVLVSYSSDYIYMFNLKEDGRTQKFETNTVDGTTTVTSTTPDQPGDQKGNDSQKYPPIKRLRLRGDWSDTGPNARPERERAEQDRGSVNIMQRMSEMLTRLLEGAARHGGDQEQGALGGSTDAAQLSSDLSGDLNNDQTRTDSTGSSSVNNAPSDPPASEPVPSSSNSRQVPDATVTSAFRNMQEPGLEASGQSSGNQGTLNELAEGAADSTPAQARTQARMAVQAISQTIQEEKIEPVISLQYRSEGTSASTIRVELANVAVPSETLMPVSQSNNPVPPILESNNAPQTDTVTESNIVSLSESPDETSTEFTACNYLDYLSENPGCSDTQSDTDNKCNISESCASETVLPDLETDEESKMSEGNVQDVPQSSNSDSASTENVVATDNVEDSESRTSENRDSERMTLHLTPQISVEEYISPEREDPPSEETSENQEDSQQGRGNDESDAGEGLPSLRGATSPLISRSVPRAGSSGVGASVRQRRFGHSGPPTGDFQLHSDDNDDEEDSDTDLMRAHQNKYARPTRDENLAARRLQALYRKRQEEKEKEEWDSRCVHQPALKQIYKGHRNARTMIKEANFWSDKYVMSGSDCGHIFIWDRYTGQLVKLLEADKHVVNCIQPHPYFPILASSGIDYDIKIWTPSAAEPSFDEKTADEIMNRNEVMLEETRDTITVPASFMLRMLASLNHVRASAAGRRGGQGAGPDDDSTSSDDD